MISVEEALKQILDAVSPLDLEPVPILEALGRVIGEDILADRAIPPRDNSAMDGYALRAADTQGASETNPAILEVVEEIPAGAIPEKRIGPGQAGRIMTGAPVPEGADAVVPLELSRTQESRVAILSEAKVGQDIRRAGEDVQPGEKVICRGDIIRPSEVGMLASLGRSSVSVHRRPLVAIIATGDELCELGEPLSPWKIVSSNSYSLAALVLDCGAVPLQLGIARDRKEDLVAKFRAAMQADLIVSSGGVSVGDYDLVKEVMQAEGNRLHFWRVAMKPGRAMAFGAIGNVPTVGLPGNPVSAMVCFEQFVRPAILKMTGHTKLFRGTVQARLNEDLSKPPGLRFFVRARIQREQDGYGVVTTGNQSSGILKSMVRANGLIILPEETTQVSAGDRVTVQLLDDSLNRAAEPGYQASDPLP